MDITNTLFIGDAIYTLQTFPDECIDFTLFSPPYDGIRDYNGYSSWSGGALMEAIADELYRVTKPGGVCAIVMGDETKDYAKSLTTFRTIVNWVDCAGWRLFECCIYNRHGRPGNWWSRRFRVDHEYLPIFFKGRKPKYFDKEHLKVPTKHAGKTFSGTQRLTSGEMVPLAGGVVHPTKCRGTIWRYAASNTEGNRRKLRHPATFPDRLAEDMIKCFTEPGDLVLDPMCGSGTTCAAAARLGRGYVGIDIDEGYIDIAREWLTELAGMA